MLGLCLVFLSTSVLGQSSDPNAAVVGVPPRVVARCLEAPIVGVPIFQPGTQVAAAQSFQRRFARDSLKDGTIVGAVIGAVAFGAAAAALCHLYQEEDGPSCAPDSLRFAAIGSIIGSGLGLAIDAARSGRPGVTVRLAIRF